LKAYLKATGLIAGMTLATNLLGFVREILFAREVGTSGEADAYVTAFSIAALCFLVFSAGSLQGAFMPKYQDQLIQGEAGQARGLWRMTLIALVVVLTAVALLINGAAEVWVGLVAPGFSTEQQSLTATLLRWLAPMIVLVGVGSLLQSVLHAHQRFMLPAIIPFLNNVVIIGFLLVAVPAYGILGLAQGTLLAAGLWLLLFPTMRRLVPTVPPKVRPKALRDLVHTMLPLMLLLIADQLSGLVQKALVSGQEPGSIAVLNYAARLEGLPVGIFAVAVATVCFPALVEAISNGDQRESAKRFGLGLSAIFFCTVPATVFLVLEPHLVVRVLLERGAFGPEATARAADALFWYALGMVPQSLIVFVNRIYFAAGDTRTPMKIGVLSAVMHVAFSWVLVDRFGYLGIAIGTTLYALVYATLLLAPLHSLFAVPTRLVWSCAWRPLLAGAVMATSYLVWDIEENLRGFLAALGIGGIVYLTIAYVLAVPILRSLKTTT